MNVLACDTSTSVMYLALVRFEDERPVFYDTCATTLGNKHSELLMTKIMELCSRSGVPVQTLDLLVCTSGPGSFTGLRIAMSTLKGISLANEIPLVSVPTLDVYQKAVRHYPGVVLSVIDAKKQRFYAALSVHGERRSEDLDINTEQIEQLISGYPTILLTGADAPQLFAKLGEKIQAKTEIEPYHGGNFGLALADLGRETYVAKGEDDRGKGPVYVRKSDAEIALLHTIHSLEVSHD
ncbi:MAG: tRNA (adenosine(37)-N6)-threonylcarbamoyltransferase complex dimerization subunit type 1 TsaB [Sphaerochaeta sp.]